MKRAVVLIAAVLACALTARLGVWQLDRAAQKMALQARMDEQAKLAPLGNADLLDHLGDLQRRVVLRGRWVPDKTIWLDNRPMTGRTGFFVLTPLQLEDAGVTILVQRGWAPRNQLDRAVLPPLITPSGMVEVQGRLTAGPSRLFEFAPSTSGPIRQNLDPALYGIQIRQPMLPMTIWQTGSTEDGLKRDWAAPDLGLQTHYGYAFQWFALCALILGLYVWFQLVKPRRRQR